MTPKDRADQTRPLYRRLRRLGWLLANLGACVRFAGGVGRFLKRALHTLAAGQWRHLVAWMVTAVSFVHRSDGGRYRRWLAGMPPAQPPDGEVKAVLSSVGVPERRLAEFLALVSSHCRPWLGLVVIVEGEQRRQVEAHFEASGQMVCIVERGGSEAEDMLSGLHQAMGEDGEDFRYVALLAPGCVPGDMPLAATGSVLLYGDEDEIDRHGERRRPFFKPAFSPDLLLRRDYLSSCLVLTADLARSVAERAPPSVPDLHSLALLLTDVAEHVEHVDAFTAHRFLPPPKAEIPGHLASHLRRHYGEGSAVHPTGQGWTCSFGSPASKVSIIIPTRDRLDLLAPCIEGIHATNQGGFEVIILNNGSVAPETKRWLAAAPSRFPALTVVDAPEPFNWSRLNNLGMRHAAGDVFLFLNNDTEAACEGWLDRLADVALRADVGAVGTLLLYPDGLIQHAGVVTGFGGCADHIYVGTDPDAGEGMFVPPTVPRDVSAVTGACLAVARSTVDVIGGFDEGYRVIGSDVEFCIRALRAGRHNVYLPDVRLIHHESQSRTRKDPQADVERLRALIAQCPPDPYFNPNLSMISLYPSYPM